MARISGVDLPRDKRVEIALTYIFGVGKNSSQKILKVAKIDRNVRVKDLKEEDVARIREIIDKNYKVEGELRQEVVQNIKRLMEINCYRGMRHKRSLPVRGQRTRTNARTRKGPRKTVVGKKKTLKV